MLYEYPLWSVIGSALCRLGRFVLFLCLSRWLVCSFARLSRSLLSVNGSVETCTTDSSLQCCFSETRGSPAGGQCPVQPRQSTQTGFVFCTSTGHVPAEPARGITGRSGGHRSQELRQRAGISQHRAPVKGSQRPASASTLPLRSRAQAQVGWQVGLPRVPALCEPVRSPARDPLAACCASCLGHRGTKGATTRWQPLQQPMLTVNTGDASVQNMRPPFL